MNLFRLGFLGVLLFCFLNDILGQDTIYLNNPSFEDTPRRGGGFSSPINGWIDCGLMKFPGETPPDIHPVPGTAWGVDQKAIDGKTYLGLVIRYNDTWESVSQGLEGKLDPNKCYSFQANLSLSPKYESGTKQSPNLENFSHPAVLAIWGGNYFCDKNELLATSVPVNNYEWKEYQFKFVPTVASDYLTLEAFYYFPEKGTPYYQPEPYNGHILIDHLSPIIEISCD